MASDSKRSGPGRRLAFLGSRRWLRWLLIVAGIGSLLVGAGVAVAALWAFTILPRSLPSVSALETFQPLVGTKIYDDNDELVTELHVERRIFVPLAQMPQTLRDAVIATEDRRFYYHWGIDPIGIARAFVQNYRRGRLAEGGSTITQQLTKVLFLTPDKSLERKVKEAVLALELERRYSKDRILEMYLNQVYFGHGAYGVEAAARTYFGKSVSEINVREAALLAGLPRAPTSYSPFEHGEAASAAAVVLRRMVDTVRSRTDAKRWPAPISASSPGAAPPTRRTPGTSSELEAVAPTSPGRAQRLHHAQSDAPARGRAGATRRAQGPREPYAEGGAAGRASGRRRRHHRPGHRLRAGHGGRLRLLPQRVQPRSPGPAPARLGLQAVHLHRRAGGGLHGGHPGRGRAGVLRRRPAARPEAGRPQVPRPDDLQQALEESVGIVTVKVQERVGLSRTIQVARRFGITSPLDVNLSLALGTSDLTLIELTAAYGALANQGQWLPPTSIRYLTDAQGKLVEEHLPEPREAVSPETAYLITHMLRGVVERGTGQAAKVLGRPIAAKTGTTNDYSNAWFIGYTPRVATGIWVGYDRPRSLGKDETGSRVAVPIWVNYMGKVLGDSPKEDFAMPDHRARPVDLIRRTSACGSS
jgi:penicillin-binding protein 1A